MDKISDRIEEKQSVKTNWSVSIFIKAFHPVWASSNDN